LANYTEIIEQLIKVDVVPYNPANGLDTYDILYLNMTKITPVFFEFNIKFKYPNNITTSVKNAD